MEIFRDDYVRLNTGKITRVTDVINKRHYSSDDVIDFETQDIYTEARKRAYNITEVVEHSRDKAKLDKRRKKATNWYEWWYNDEYDWDRFY